MKICPTPLFFMGFLGYNTREYREKFRNITSEDIKGGIFYAGNKRYDNRRTADDGQKRWHDPDAERYALRGLPFRRRGNTGRSKHGARHGYR